MKAILIIALLGLSLATPARAAADVSMDEDPMFAEMMSEGEPPADRGAASDVGEEEGDDAASLEAAAEKFSQSCFADLGPASACFEDYDSAACSDTRRSCRLAGHYSR